MISSSNQIRIFNHDENSSTVNIEIPRNKTPLSDDECFKIDDQIEEEKEPITT